MKEITRGILIGLITTAIIAGFGYVWLVRENQLRIQIMQRDMDRLSFQVESGNNSLYAIKLFVVSAHPDRNMLPVSSANKLQRLEPKEMATLAALIGRYSSAKAFSQRVPNDDPRLGSFLANHEINQNDLQNYWHMARGQKFNDKHEP